MNKKLTLFLILLIVISGILIAYRYSIQSKTDIDKNPSTNTDQSFGSSPQEIPNSKLKYNIEGGNPSAFLIEMKFDNSYYDYDYTIDVENSSGYINLLPPPERMNVKVHITAISESGEKSDTYVVSNSEWWTKVENAVSGYASEHTFKFNN